MNIPKRRIGWSSGGGGEIPRLRRFSFCDDGPFQTSPQAEPIDPLTIFSLSSGRATSYLVGADA